MLTLALLYVMVAGLLVWLVLGVIDEFDLGPQDAARVARFLHLMSGDAHDQ